MIGWFVVHDSETVTRRKPEGGAVHVKADSVDAVMGYESGGATMRIHGTYLHTTEDRDVVLDLIRKATS